MGRLRKFWALSRLESETLFEAGFFLLLSNFCIKTMPWRHIDRFLRAGWKDAAKGNVVRSDDIKLVRRSISRAANLLPCKSLCLSQSIAEFIMLRRRGIPAVMFAGVSSSNDSSLYAHAWVETALEANDRSSTNSIFTTLVRIGQLDPN
jgi:hypothetical protein